jgi:hypothetical protein
MPVAPAPVADDHVVAMLRSRFPRDHNTAWFYADNGTERIRKSDGQVQRWMGASWTDQGEPYGRFNNLTVTDVKRLQPPNPDLEPCGGINILTTEDGQLGLGVVEVIDLANRRDVWLDEQTLERIEQNPKLTELWRSAVKEWGTGMVYLMEDVSFSSFFKDAVAKEKEVRGDDDADRLDALSVKVNALLIQAAQYNKAPTARMAEVFGVRLAELTVEVDQVERKVAEIRAALELAGVAVMEAFS